MTITLDFADYVRPPRINATTGVALGIRLIRAQPPDLSSAELAALMAVRSTAQGVQDSVGARHRSSGSNLRPLGRRFGGAWAGLHGRLDACTRLVNRPESQRATVLIASLFPNGTRFLIGGYEGAWFHSRMLIDWINNEGLRDEIDELAGEMFLDEIELSHAALGEGLGLDENTKAVPNDEPGVGERVAALAEAVGRYGRVLSGSVDMGDPASRNRFMAAVAPIDALRARNRRVYGAGGTDEPLDSEEAVETADEAMGEDEFDVDSPIPSIEGE